MKKSSIHLILYKEVLIGVQNNFLHVKCKSYTLFHTCHPFHTLFHHFTSTCTCTSFQQYYLSYHNIHITSAVFQQALTSNVMQILENKNLGVAASVSFQYIAAAPIAEETIPMLNAQILSSICNVLLTRRASRYE